MTPARALPGAIWALGFVSLLMDVSSEMIHSLLPVFLYSALGVGTAVIGMIEGAAEATALIVKVFSGVVSDYWGRRKPAALAGYALGALSKPLFALATGPGMVVAARLIDRVGKGIRGAPRDALVADLAPPGLRGAAFGLRQALDTLGAFLGPLLAMALMLAWSNDFRAVFRVAVIPGVCAALLLAVAVREPAHPAGRERVQPLRRAALRALSAGYWRVVALGAVFTLARFSEAFLVLRARDGGLPIAYAPLVLIGMNVVYAAAAYPCGKLADRVSHTRLLVAGIAVLVLADAALAYGDRWYFVAPGIALWGLHLAMTQGLLATMVAATAPPALRGTAFGLFNLVRGIAMLVGSTGAGLLWERYGASATFLAGGAFAAGALVLTIIRRPSRVAS
ncbi:MAG: MFS transporter [Gammaproteobacteria bacterium]|nr:MFS transporter [Gammaproteobacteria bacterium]